MSSLCHVPLFAFALAILPVGSAHAFNFKEDGCMVKDVAVFPGSRVHLHCTAALAGTSVEFLAVPSSNRDDANRLLATFLSAQSMKAPLDVQFDLDDTSASAFGCQAQDCRVPLGVIVMTPVVIAQQQVVAPATALLVPEPDASLLGGIACAVLFGLALGRVGGS
jgi:hypothetical protein